MSTILLLILSVLFYTLAGFLKGIKDTLLFHYSSSIFRYRSRRYWDPQESWKNKYKNGDPKQGPAFWGSTTIFVWLTDAWHLFQTFELSCHRAALVFLGSAFFRFSETGWQNALSWFVVWIALIFIYSAGFHLTYSVWLPVKKINRSMNRFLTIFSLLLTISLGAQIPQEYQAQYQAAEDKYVLLLKEGGYDFAISPIESIPLEPTAYQMQTGNWANQYYQVSKYEDAIKKRKQRKVIGFIHDTAGEWDHRDLLFVARNDLGATYTGESSPKDGNGHGTHCAGAIGAISRTVPLGVARVLAESQYLGLAPHKTLANNGGGQYRWVARSLRDGVKKGKTLQKQGYFIFHSLSLGGGGDDPEVSAAIEEARKAGQLVIIAAGNESGPISFPGRDPNAWCIGALDNMDGKRAPYSNYGDNMFAAAPGSDIVSTYLNDRLQSLSGTSMATPIHAALAAITASIHPQATAYQIEHFFAEKSKDLGAAGWDPEFGYGSGILGEILEANLTRYPDEPVHRDDNQDPEVPTRENRTVVFDLGGFQTNWKTINGGGWNPVTVHLKVRFKTDLYDECAYDGALEATRDYFRNRYFVLLDEHGFSDAAYWVRHFYEMHMKRDVGTDVTVETIEGIDEDGRVAIPDRKALQRLRSRLKTWSDSPITFRSLQKNRA